MLICIIALLKDESYDNGVGLPRSSNKLPSPGKHRLTKCNNVSNTTLEIAPRLIIDKNESQTDVFATLLTERLNNPLTLNKTASTPTKSNAYTHFSGQKDANPANIFCFPCGLSLFEPTDSCFNQYLKEFQH